MGRCGKFLRPEDRCRRKAFEKRQARRRLVLVLGLAAVDASLAWLMVLGYIHPVVAGWMMALHSGWLGFRLGRGV